MGEHDDASDVGAEETASAAGAAAGGSETGGDESPSVPRAALLAERKQRQELATRLAEYEAAEAARAREAAEKAGEFQSLYEAERPKREAAEQKAAALEALVVAERDRRLDAIPKAHRPPYLDALPLDKQLEAVAWAEKQIATDTAVGGVRARGSGKPSIPADCEAEWKREAARNPGIGDLEWFHASVWKPRQDRAARLKQT